MFGLTFKGIKNGSSSLGTPSIGGHYRPFDCDSFSRTFVQPSVLGNVRSEVGKTSNNGVFQRIQLSCNTHQSAVK